jgi:hypothetical protein
MQRRQYKAHTVEIARNKASLKGKNYFKPDLEKERGKI